MSSLLKRLKLYLQAARELGLRRLVWYALYQLGRASGYYRRVTPLREWAGSQAEQRPFPTILYRPELSTLLDEAARKELLAEADEIVQGRVRLFGGEPVALEVCPPGPAVHWTDAGVVPGVEDIKFVWEPARLGWVYPLGRAYLLTGNETYSETFWQRLEQFLECNPPNQGPNWASAQEAALRILALVFASQAFSGSEQYTGERIRLLRAAIAEHAQRIPATLAYARAQNNNHWISEAVGLYTAGVMLSEHPQAARWRRMGWAELHYALQNQIDETGEYVQHSTNYHRFILQAALWAQAVARSAGDAFPARTLQRLAAATRWLSSHYDPLSGRAANLGHNDGAYILPLAAGGFGDYRPALQAAAIAYLERPLLPPGPWDEFSRWMGLPIIQQPLSLTRLGAMPNRLGDARSWASLRAVHFHHRPAHADQLHVDLWWQGINVALDAGTYAYNASPPWDNSLMSTLVHNTINIDGQDQMQRAGRFLWLHWAQARLIDSGANQVTAEHDGYAHLGVLHRRSLARLDTFRWRINDVLLPVDPAQPTTHTARLHWLLPDWPWTLEDFAITLRNPAGRVTVTMALAEQGGISACTLQLVRCGKALFGPPETQPILGWYAPCYGLKMPALSFSLTTRSQLPLHLSTHWTFEA